MPAHVMSDENIPAPTHPHPAVPHAALEAEAEAQVEAVEPVHPLEPGPVAPSAASEVVEVEERTDVDDDTEEEWKPEEQLEDMPTEDEPKAVMSEVEPESEPEAAPIPVEAPPANLKRWYVVKVQSNREDTIKAAIERKVKIEGLEELYGQIAVPVEEYMEKKKVKTTDKKTGEKVTQEKTVAKNRKKFPGYIFAEVQYDDRILYLFRETSGVADFVGATMHRAPTPMTDREVEAMLTGVHRGEKGGKSAKKVVKIDIEKGDKVRVREGAFSGMEGEVKLLSEPKDADETPKVTVVVTVFGRPVDVTLDYWQVDKA